MNSVLLRKSNVAARKYPILGSYLVYVQKHFLCLELIENRKNLNGALNNSVINTEMQKV